ncbi:MAG: hypothetical protein AAF799_31605 [Myxococcota bacterium]
MRWLCMMVTGSLVATISCAPSDTSGGGEAASTGGEASSEIGSETTDPAPTEPPADSSGEPPPTADSSTGPSDVCGDGILEGIEECDDGNRTNGDGCDNDCTLNLDTSIWEATHPGDAMVRESGEGIAVDSMGNIVVGGWEVDAVGDPNMWLAKYDTEGTQLWTVQLDPSGGMDDRIYGVAIDPMDNLLLVGDSDVAPSSSDIWVSKRTPDGDELWTTTFDGPEGGNDGGRGIASDAEGNMFVTGFYRVANNDNDVFIARLGPQGDTQWEQTVAGPKGLDDRGQGVVVDPDGDAYIAGFVSLGGFNRNVWLRKVDAEGDELWTEQWDSNTNADDAGFGIAIAPDGSVAVAGMTPVVANNQDVWLGRWDGDGTLQWTKQFGGQAFVNDEGFAVAADAESNFIVVGFRGMSATDSDIWMRKYDVGGNVLWSQVVAGTGMDRDQATAVATDGLDIVVTGEIRNAMSNDGDIWLGKFGPG